MKLLQNLFKLHRLSILTLSPFIITYCDNNNKGFHDKIQSHPALSPIYWKKPLVFSGSGMRRKLILFFEVDVYLAGLNLLDQTLDNLQTNQELSPSKAVLESQNFPDLDGQPVALITCRFVRDIGLTTILDAFETTFSGLPQDDVKEFREQLGRAVGTKGVKTNDEVIFAWLNKGGMKIMLNGVVGGSIMNPAVEERLIETYVDEKRTVSPELCHSLLEFRKKIQK